ncbi:histone H1 [Pedobacter sp. HDW13]|uniref:histone H1 n=1 Tax=Pedobacter sp. HDW13 TaxID=2714940 RepID=UPI0014082F24|nr:histone H1 [Pedobacter sp. HDW13]QIL37957.1 histone H1 [Pedobacter sp. HDW13]
MGNFNSYNQQKMSELKEQMAIAEAEAAKYFEGNQAAEEKLNKALEQIQTTAQLLRNGMSEKKNAR